MLNLSNGAMKKYQDLQSYLKDLGSVIIAFSGGVDSTFLAKVAHDVLQDHMIAITITSPNFIKREMKDAIDFCKKEGISHMVNHFDTLSIPGFQENPVDRCYICKKALFQKLLKYISTMDFDYVCDGTNVDDTRDFRPGLRALDELQIKSPLKEVGLTKEEIRELSDYLGLSSWNKPSNACLASRFVYGEKITEEKLTRVERAELLLYDLGFTQCRVRIHGDNLARIELLPDDFYRIIDNDDMRNQIYTALKQDGFDYITLDLQGYRTGSMNETLKQ